jgi:hypothetical protein
VRSEEWNVFIFIELLVCRAKIQKREGIEKSEKRKVKNKKTYTPKLRRDEVKSEKFFIILQRE